MNEFEDFREFCQQVTDEQLVSIYWKETGSNRTAFAAIARAVADGRNIDLVHAERMPNETST